jgi:hypothetical protein
VEGSPVYVRSILQSSCGAQHRSPGSPPTRCRRPMATARGWRDRPSNRAAPSQRAPARDSPRRLPRGPHGATTAGHRAGGALGLRRWSSPEPPQRGEAMEPAALPSLSPGLGDDSAGATRRAIGNLHSACGRAAAGHPTAPWDPPGEPTANHPRPVDSDDLSDLESVVAEADFRGLASQAELRAQVEGNEGRRGVAKLRRVLGLPGGPRRTRFAGRNSDGAASPGGRNERLRDQRPDSRYEVDVLWRSEQVAVEIDGWDAHSGRLAFERDRLKTAELSARGLMALESRGGRSATTRAA